MEYGFALATRGPMATPEALATLARRGEEMGFDIISLSDHIVMPRSFSSRYPYSETGEFIGGGSGIGEASDYLELLATASFLAGQTSRARLLTSVMVLPYRNPLITAKILTTIDVLSNGRLIVGCGVGWMREEFEAIGAPPYNERGAVANEYIRAFKELWTNDNPSFEGQYCRFADLFFLPAPVQKPHPPIWVGGESPGALRRAARLGDAWYPVNNNAGFPLGTPKQHAEYASRLHRYAEEAGRDPYDIDLAYLVNHPAEYLDGEAQFTADGERRMFTGEPEQIAGDIKAYERNGVRHIVLNFQSDRLEDTLERMERFAATVKPLVDD